MREGDKTPDRRRADYYEHRIKLVLDMWDAAMNLENGVELMTLAHHMLETSLKKDRASFQTPLGAHISE